MKVIANPVAGRRAGRAISRLRRLLDERRIDYEFWMTKGRGDATELARRAVESGARRVVVAGGDGTISEAVNGLVGSAVEMALVSIGTGNDFARSLELPYNDVDAAVRIAIHGGSRPVDVGREKERFFISGLGVGFPSAVAELSSRLRWLGGSVTFALAVYRALNRMRPIPIRLELDGLSRDLTCTSILVQNTRFTGGGLLVAPEASVDDGWFDVVIVGMIGKLELALNFPRLYKGTHCDHPAFSICRARTIRIESQSVLRKMFDGDLFGCSPVQAEVVERAVRIVTGRRVVSGPNLKSSHEQDNEPPRR